MRHLTIQSVGTALAVESIHAVAVYHKKDGRVCHLHHVITYENQCCQPNATSALRVAMPVRCPCGSSKYSVRRVKLFSLFGE
jgi:hypothetical protein